MGRKPAKHFYDSIYLLYKIGQLGCEKIRVEVEKSSDNLIAGDVNG